eukprot:2673962-Lingulodinium_polyedra.AAC.1
MPCIPCMPCMLCVPCMPCMPWMRLVLVACVVYDIPVVCVAHIMRAIHVRRDMLYGMNRPTNQPTYEGHA